MHPSAIDTSMQRLRVKPRLRGISHLAGFVVSLWAGTMLTLTAPAGVARLAALVYTLGLAAMYGTSALYHVPMWTPRARKVLRRLDHATIFLLIAGTYTPFCLLSMPRELGTRLLVVVWLGAAIGVVRAVAWVRPPRWLTAGLCVALGWVAVFSFPDLRAGIGSTGLGLLLAGGLVYSLGAVVYATKRPDPAPHVFGYHEVFHVMVIVASVLHFAAVERAVLPMAG